MSPLLSLTLGEQQAAGRHSVLLGLHSVCDQAARCELQLEGCTSGASPKLSVGGMRLPEAIFCSQRCVRGSTERMWSGIAAQTQGPAVAVQHREEERGRGRSQHPEVWSRGVTEHLAWKSLAGNGKRGRVTLRLGRIQLCLPGGSG